MSEALIPYDAHPTPGLVRPVSTPAEAVAAMQEFQALKTALLGPADYQSIQGKRYVKRSGWRRLALAFGINCEIVREERRELLPVGFVWEITARATAPNGRFMDATGACASTERPTQHEHHDIRATAETRAKNRAIADLVGGGELSADELAYPDHEPQRARAQATPRTTPPARPTPVRPATAQHEASGDWAATAQLLAIEQLLSATGSSRAAQEAQLGHPLDQLSRQAAGGLIRELQAAKRAGAEPAEVPACGEPTPQGACWLPRGHSAPHHGTDDRRPTLAGDVEGEVPF